MDSRKSFEGQRIRRRTGEQPPDRPDSAHLGPIGAHSGAHFSWAELSAWDVRGYGEKRPLGPEGPIGAHQGPIGAHDHSPSLWACECRSRSAALCPSQSVALRDGAHLLAGTKRCRQGPPYQPWHAGTLGGTTAEVFIPSGVPPRGQRARGVSSWHKEWHCHSARPGGLCLRPSGQVTWS